jgi:protein SCO1/2
MKSAQRSVFIILAVAAAGLIAVLAWTQLRPYEFHGLLLQSSPPAADFTLVGPGARLVGLSDFRGKLVVLYFGYTFCPDVCPTTLAEVGQAMRKLGQRADGVQVIMVTVDPERDTPEHLAEYVSHFHPTFLGLSGAPEQIATAAAAFSIYYQKHEGTAATGYLVDHTATVTVLDRDGRVRLVWPFGTDGDAMAADLGQLLR